MTKNYKIELKKSAAKEFKKLPKDIYEKALEAFKFLSQNPFSEILKIKKMKGVDFLYRIRIGDYRMIYEVSTTKLIIIIIKISNRKDVYKRF